MPHIAVSICITIVSCAREQSKMAAFTKRLSCKVNRRPRGNTVQRQETLLVNMTSRGQRVVKMLVGIITNLKCKDGFEGCCAHYSLLSILSLLSCKSWTVDRSRNLGLCPVGVKNLVGLARHFLVHKDLSHLHRRSKGC